MVKATPCDKAFIVDIPVDSFYDNASVNYIIKLDKKKFARIRGLMQYSFDLPAQILFYFVNKILLQRNNCDPKLRLPLFPGRVTRRALLTSTLILFWRRDQYHAAVLSVHRWPVGSYAFSSGQTCRGIESSCLLYFNFF